MLKRSSILNRLFLVLCLVFAITGCNKKKNGGNKLTSAGSNSLSENGEFSVISVTPQGELSSSVRYPSIQIQFSEQHHPGFTPGRTSLMKRCRGLCLS